MCRRFSSSLDIRPGVCQRSVCVFSPQTLTHSLTPETKCGCTIRVSFSIWKHAMANPKSSTHRTMIQWCTVERLYGRCKGFIVAIAKCGSMSSPQRPLSPISLGGCKHLPDLPLLTQIFSCHVSSCIINSV